LWHDQATLQQHGAQLVDQRRPLRHQPITRTVQDLDVELRLALQLDKAHRGPGRRLGDRFRIPVVVLLRLDVGSHILGRHQAHFMSHTFEDATKMVRPAAGLHRHHRARQPCSQLRDTIAAHPPPKNDATRSIQSDHAAAVLAQVDA
jgi:hypothetical protein